MRYSLLVMTLLCTSASAADRPPRVFIHADGVKREEADLLPRFARLAAELEAQGARVLASHAWPDDAGLMDVIVLLGPGASSDDDTPTFSRQRVDDLVDVTCRGGRVLLVSNAGPSAQHRVVNALLHDLIVGIRVSDERYPVGSVASFAVSPLTAGLDRLDGRGMARLELSGTARALVTAPSGTPWASDTLPQCAGEPHPGLLVVLTGLAALDDRAVAETGGEARWRTLVHDLVPVGVSPRR